jgi:hypothetical protein
VGQQVGLAAFAGDTDRVAEDTDGEEFREVRDTVERSPSDELIHEFSGKELELLPQGPDAAGGNDPGHRGAHWAMDGWVRFQDPLRAPRRFAMEVFGADASAGDERFIVLQDLFAFFEPGKGQDAILRQPHCGTGGSHPLEQRIRMGEIVVAIGIIRENRNCLRGSAY